MLGAGTMGAGIAICALDAGLQVVLLEQDAHALRRGQQRVTEHYQSRVASGKMEATSCNQNWVTEYSRVLPARFGVAKNGIYGRTYRHGQQNPDH